MADCIFCKIVSGEIPVKLLHQDEHCVAFADVNPQAPVHLLLVPREHLTSLAQADDTHHALLEHLLHTAPAVAKAAGLAGGYRVVINTGKDGGQTVDHLHLHILGGRAMHWPPG